MTWFDGLLILGAVALVLFEARQEVGRSAMDALAVLAASQFAGALADPATYWLGWKPVPGWDYSPYAHALCFGLLCAGFLAFSLVLHRNTRWSMDQLDPLFGFALALVIAGVVGHTLAQVLGGVTVASTGRMPEFLTDSLLGEELRSFRTYHHVVNVLQPN